MRREFTLLLGIALLLSACARGSKDLEVTLSPRVDWPLRVAAAKRLDPKERKIACDRLLDYLDLESNWGEETTCSILDEIGDMSVAVALRGDRYKTQRGRDEGKGNASVEGTIEAILERNQPNQISEPAAASGRGSP